MAIRKLNRGFPLIRILIAALMLIICIYPVFYVFMSSVKTTVDFQQQKPYELPSEITFANYQKIIEQGRILTYFKNSIIITFFTVLFILILASMAGFGLSKFSFRGNRMLRSYFNLGLMLPIQVSLIPLFYIFSRIDILDTYPAVIIPQVAFGLAFSIQLFYSFYKFLPNDVIESGIIDGCTPMQVFIRIVTPMAQNTYLTVATMQGVFCWNEFITTYTMTKSVRMKTVTLGLNDFVGTMGLTDWGATFAMIILTILPTLILYFFTNKHMVSGIAAGSVKG